MTEAPRPAGEARLDQARRIYDGIIAGDLDRAMAGAADAIEWRNPAEAIEPGTRHGKTSFAEAVTALFAEFDFERLEILDSAELGETVALKVRVVATGRGSGAPFETVFGNVFRFDADQVLAFEWSPDPAAALAAVGANRWPGDAAGS
jgi:ketosteroid isomerase-like protein